MSFAVLFMDLSMSVKLFCSNNVQSLMIAAIPNIIGWLAISFAKVRQSYPVVPIFSPFPECFISYQPLFNYIRTSLFSTWEDFWKDLVWV